MEHHAAGIAGMVAGTLAFAVCEGVTAGAGTIACAAIAGAVGNAVSYGIKAAQTGHFSWGALGKTMLEGAFTGLVFAGAGAGLGKAFNALGGGRLLAGLAGRVLGGGAGRVMSSAPARMLAGLAEGAGRPIGAARSLGASLRRAVGGGLRRDAGAAEGGAAEAGAAEAGAAEAGGGGGGGCLVHSFVAATPVLMAGGGVKSIAKVAAGDKVVNAVPGQGGKTEVHTVERVIVTTTDRDFVDLAVATRDEHGRLLGVGRLTTTFHHPFYDVTRSAFVDAADLRPGDRLQRPGGGTAEVLTVERYTAARTTYDLTINDLHTYYVEAGDTPVLVHNSNGCGWRAGFDALADGKQVGSVKVVDNATGLRTLFDGWTAGARRLPARGSKIPDVFKLEDDTVIQWRTASQSGGETIDIFRPGAKPFKVHIDGGN